MMMSAPPCAASPPIVCFCVAGGEPGSEAPPKFGLLGRLRAAQVARPPARQAPMLRPTDLRAEVRIDALNLLRALREASA